MLLIICSFYFAALFNFIWFSKVGANLVNIHSNFQMNCWISLSESLILQMLKLDAKISYNQPNLQNFMRFGWLWCHIEPNPEEDWTNIPMHGLARCTTFWYRGSLIPFLHENNCKTNEKKWIKRKITCFMSILLQF